MRTAVVCKKALARAGLRCVVEKDATIGHEFIVYDPTDRTIATGYTEGNKTDALNEACEHPAVHRLIVDAAAWSAT